LGGINPSCLIKLNRRVNVKSQCALKIRWGKKRTTTKRKETVDRRIVLENFSKLAGTSR